jgi:hypothetical protein
MHQGQKCINSDHSNTPIPAYYEETAKVSFPTRETHGFASSYI